MPRVSEDCVFSFVVLVGVVSLVDRRYVCCPCAVYVCFLFFTQPWTSQSVCRPCFSSGFVVLSALEHMQDITSSRHIYIYI